MAAPPSGSSTIKYLTIKAGETGTLKTNVKILSVVVSGNAEVESDCIDLPEPEQLVCFSLKWATESDSGGGTGPWSVGDTDARLKNIVISSTIYNSDLPIDGDPASGSVPSGLEDYVNANIPPSVMTPVDLAASVTGERRELTYTFLAPESIGPTVYFEFTAPGLSDEVGARIYAESCPDCCEEET